MEQKKCPRCGETKTVENFHRRSNGGLYAYCRPCHKIRDRERYLRYRETVKLAAKERYAANTEQVKTQRREQYSRHRESQQASRCGQCGATGPASEFPKPYLCRECHRLYGQSWRTANPGKASVSTMRWRAQNPGYSRMIDAVRRARKLQGDLPVNVHPLYVLEYWDNECCLCGEDVNPQSFHMAHYIPLTRGGMHNIWNLRPAHPKCNNEQNDRMPWELEFLRTSSGASAPAQPAELLRSW